MSHTNKVLYGEVSTDDTLILEMLDMIPREKYKDPTLRWLDPACGKGNFMIVLAERLFHSLAPIIPHPSERRRHIHENMLFMIEINKEHIPHLHTLFPWGNIAYRNFLSYRPAQPFDIIIGNPPFNSGGLKKVPTNTKRSKRTDGETIWPQFVKHAFSMLREGGILSMLTPSIWMKPDKAGIYSLLTGTHSSPCSLEKIRCFTNTQTNRLFHGKAQTPTCIFTAKKAPRRLIISLYESTLRRYIPYPFYGGTQPLPVFAASVFAKLQPYIYKCGTPTFYKSSMPPKKALLSLERTDAQSHCNIRSCILKKNTPTLVYEYSDIPLAFAGQSKLILAHKMYGFPYYDASGTLGISRRDNYIMTHQTKENFKKWRDFLSTKFAIYLMEGTRYRMKYLEKYFFQLIPDIIQLRDFPSLINDETIADYFQLTSVERKGIDELHKKKYEAFPFDV